MLDAAVTALVLPQAPAGDLSLSVTLTADAPAAVDLVLECSTDDGLTWRPASLGDDATARDLAADSAGRSHQVVWNALADIGFRPTAGTRLRATPERDGRLGSSLEVTVPAFDNLAAAARRVEHYMIHYGSFDEERIRLAETFDLVILHPFSGQLPAATIHDIQNGLDADDPADDVIVLAYISVGEDLRTIGMSDSALLLDPRFVGDGSGPRVDPRGPDADGTAVTGLDPLGSPSNGGTGYASWYLDDNSIDQSPTNVGDGLPDRNGIFGGCFVNAGDPAWFDVLDQMTVDGIDGVQGMQELLRSDVGRGYACDGLFLDTIDTCAPNHYTDASSINQSEFEWTAKGFADFMARLRTSYPERLILQNRGLFFFDPRQVQYAVTTRPSIDFLFVESYRLNSNTTQEYDDYFFADNKHTFAPKLMAEAGRPDGFHVLSLGYAEGPALTMDTNTLLGTSDLGFESLLTDIEETQNLAGFRHYITSAGVDLPNDFVRTYADLTDTTPPAWTSTYNDNELPYPTPPEAPTPRVGLQAAIAGSGHIVLRWDVALDLNHVGYALYYDTQPLDFVGDPTLSGATRVVLEPKQASDYATSFGALANEDVLPGLTPGTTYHLCIRAFDALGNEERNTVTLSATPVAATPITIDGSFDDWLSVPVAHEDPADAPASSGADWRRIWITNDAVNLYIRYTSESAFNLDGSPGFGYSRTLIFLDADDDPSTGYTVAAGIGSELLVSGAGLYAQAGGIFNDGYIGPLDINPTTNVVEVELAVPLADIRAAHPGASQLRLLFLNDEVGDRAPDTGALLYRILSAP